MIKMEQAEIQIAANKYQRDADELAQRMQRAGDDISDCVKMLTRLKIDYVRNVFGIAPGSTITLGADTVQPGAPARVLGMAASDSGFNPLEPPSVRARITNDNGRSFSGMEVTTPDYTLADTGPILTESERALVLIMGTVPGARLSFETLKQSPDHWEAGKMLMLFDIAFKRHGSSARGGDPYLVLQESGK